MTTPQAMVVRRVEGVSILAWDPVQPQSMVVELRRLVDNGGAKHVLVDLSQEEWIRADSLETLSEATTVCRERGCAIGIFGLREEIQQLVSVMSLAAHLPPMVGDDEQSALSAIQKMDQLPEAPKLDIEMDLATAPTARFDPQQVGSAAPPGGGGSAELGEDDLLTVNWADLTQTGYQLGGEGADTIMASCQGATTTPRHPDEDVIDLGDDAPSDAAAPALSPSEVETAAGVLGGAEDAGSDFSPLDSGKTGPPSFMGQQSPAQTAPPPQPAPIQPAAQAPTQQGAPVPGASPYYGDVDTGDETVMMQLSPEALAAAVQSYETEADDQAVMFQPSPAQMAQLAGLTPPAETPQRPSGQQQRPPVQRPPAARPQTPPPPAQRVVPGSAFADDSDDDDQAVMFTPGAFDAALLAEVAAAAGPESKVPVPDVQPPPEPPPVNGEEGELRSFLRDYAIRTAGHVTVLERFLDSGDEALGPNDLHTGGNNRRAALLAILDELVQCKLVRRTRSSRVRGGTGFVFSASPAVRSQVVRLVKLWQGAQTRSKVAGWLAG